MSTLHWLFLLLSRRNDINSISDVLTVVYAFSMILIALGYTRKMNLLEKVFYDKFVERMGAMAPSKKSTDCYLFLVMTICIFSPVVNTLIILNGIMKPVVKHK